MAKAPTRDWPNPTKAAVRLSEGEDAEKVGERIKRLLGDGALLEDVGHRVGPIDDATVHLRLSPDGEQIQARIEHADFEQWERHLRKDKAGKVYIWNEKMRVRADKQRGGIGASRLRAQVENAF